WPSPPPPATERPRRAATTRTPHYLTRNPCTLTPPSPPIRPDAPPIHAATRAGYRVAKHPPGCAKVGRREAPEALTSGRPSNQHRSRIAQLAEQPAVNRQVIGSSPIAGAHDNVSEAAAPETFRVYRGNG